MLTRQAFYPFAELPKAFYIFVRLERLNDFTHDQVRSYLLTHSDAYIFSWNLKRPDSRLNARGITPTYEEEREGRYIHCDGGHVWVHDPFHCNIKEKVDRGPWRASAEEVASGRILFENHFDAYEKRVCTLNENWIIANDCFDRLPQNKCKSECFPERYIGYQPKSPPLTYQELNTYARWLRSQVPNADNDPTLTNSSHRDDTFIYEPFRLDRSRMLTHREVMELERNISAMGYHVELDGLEKVFEEPQFLNFITQLHNREEGLPLEVIHADGMFPELPMAYFIAGLNGDRPHAQALAYYQVLEFVARRSKFVRKKSDSGFDEQALKSLLEDKQRLSNEALDLIYQVALKGEPDVLSLRTPDGRFERGPMAERIYRGIRNPTVHVAGKSDNDSIAPYSMEQFTPLFQQTIRLTRELARHWVNESCVK